MAALGTGHKAKRPKGQFSVPRVSAMIEGSSDSDSEKGDSFEIQGYEPATATGVASAANNEDIELQPSVLRAGSPEDAVSISSELRARRGSRIKESFDSLDANGDGGISPGELREALARVGLDDMADERSPHAARAVMEVDRDGDGKVDWDEFRAAMTTPGRADPPGAVTGTKSSKANSPLRNAFVETIVCYTNLRRMRERLRSKLLSTPPPPPPVPPSALLRSSAWLLDLTLGLIMVWWTLVAVPKCHSWVILQPLRSAAGVAFSSLSGGTRSDAMNWKQVLEACACLVVFVVALLVWFGALLVTRELARNGCTPGEACLGIAVVALGPDGREEVPTSTQLTIRWALGLALVPLSPILILRKNRQTLPDQISGTHVVWAGRAAAIQREAARGEKRRSSRTPAQRATAPFSERPWNDVIALCGLLVAVASVAYKMGCNPLDAFWWLVQHQPHSGARFSAGIQNDSSNPNSSENAVGIFSLAFLGRWTPCFNTTNAARCLINGLESVGAGLRACAGVLAQHWLEAAVGGLWFWLGSSLVLQSVRVIIPVMFSKTARNVLSAAAVGVAAWLAHLLATGDGSAGQFQSQENFQGYGYYTSIATSAAVATACVIGVRLAVRPFERHAALAMQLWAEAVRAFTGHPTTMVYISSVIVAVLLLVLRVAPRITAALVSDDADAVLAQTGLWEAVFAFGLCYASVFIAASHCEIVAAGTTARWYFAPAADSRSSALGRSVASIVVASTKSAGTGVLSGLVISLVSAAIFYVKVVNERLLRWVQARSSAWKGAANALLGSGLAVATPVKHAILDRTARALENLLARREGATASPDLQDDAAEWTHIVPLMVVYPAALAVLVRINPLEWCLLFSCYLLQAALQVFQGTMHTVNAYAGMYTASFAGSAFGLARLTERHGTELALNAYFGTTFTAILVALAVAVPAGGGAALAWALPSLQGVPTAEMWSGYAVWDTAIAIVVACLVIALATFLFIRTAATTLFLCAVEEIGAKKQKEARDSMVRRSERQTCGSADLLDAVEKVCYVA